MSLYFKFLKNIQQEIRLKISSPYDLKKMNWSYRLSQANKDLLEFPKLGFNKRQKMVRESPEEGA